MGVGAAAQPWLNVQQGVAFTAPAVHAVRLHVAEPGAAPREEVTFGGPGCSPTALAAPVWSNGNTFTLTVSITPLATSK